MLGIMTIFYLRFMILFILALLHMYVFIHHRYNLAGPIKAITMCMCTYEQITLVDLISCFKSNPTEI